MKKKLQIYAMIHARGFGYMNESFTIEEVANLLKISKLTVYDLIKKEELVAYRVGRQMRVEQLELERYKQRNRTVHVQEEPKSIKQAIESKNHQQVVISGQDLVLDMLSKQIEAHTKFTPLRAFNGSLNSLIAMYNGECDLVSVHLYDAETGTYNLPYVKRILVNHPFLLIHLVCRTAGIYVQKGNPLNITGWEDLAKENVAIVNREKGAGIRVLLDEQLRRKNIKPSAIKGYLHEETSHLAVASAVASGRADAGIGIENVAQMVNVDFIPMIQEQYDLVVLKTEENLHLVEKVKAIIASEAFRSELSEMNGYDLKRIGEVIYERF